MRCSGGRPIRNHPLSLCLVAGALAGAAPLTAREITLEPGQKLEEVAKDLKPGDTVLIPPGTYPGRQHLSNLHGTAEAPVVIKGTDPKDPPVFQFVGGQEGIHLTQCSYVTISTLEIEDQPGNGLNIDDGTTIEAPSHHILIENVTVRNTGPEGNHDAVKLSGVDYFVVRGLRVEGWGGQGIDCVRCHHGVIEDCHIENREGFSANNCVTMKGGSSDILVQCNFFKDPYGECVKIGGSTDLPLIYPRDAKYEATRITVAGNIMLGGRAAVSWTTADGGHAHHNTIALQNRWIMRITQEVPEEKLVELVPVPEQPNQYVMKILGDNPNPRFGACRNGVFENNVILLRRSGLRYVLNTSPGTSPASFTYRNNLWWYTDLGRYKPTAPNLASAEEGQLLQTVDPEVQDVGLPTMRVTSTDPQLSDKGAHAYETVKAMEWYWPAARQ